VFNNILLPTDGSEGSLRAAAIVADQLKANADARVTVVCAIAVIDPLRTDSDEAAVEHQNAAVRRHAEQAVDLTCSIFRRAGIACEGKVVRGDPASTAIVLETRRGGYDLIAMASRGLTMKRGDHHYFGSVTDHVVRQVDIPVLVIPMREEA
jgi:nucleotide-binding universal stress UspA family protein